MDTIDSSAVSEHFLNMKLKFYPFHEILSCRKATLENLCSCNERSMKKDPLSDNFWDDLVGVLHPLITQLTSYFHEIIIDFALERSRAYLVSRNEYLGKRHCDEELLVLEFQTSCNSKPSDTTRRPRLQAACVNNWLKWDEKKDSVQFGIRVCCRCHCRCCCSCLCIDSIEFLNEFPLKR